jgi:glutathione S-transferase
MNTMPTDNLTLYSDSRLFSPYVMSVYVSLVEKGLSFELKKVDLAKQEHYQRDYADISLSKRVPTLIHDGFCLSESSAISEYLEETFSPPQYAPLYPAERQARAKARELQAWLRSDFMPIRNERPTDVIFLAPSPEPLSQEAQACAVQLFEAVDRLLDSGSPHLFDEWCIADTDLALMLNRLVCNGDTVPEKLSAYAQMQWQRASVQSWVNQAKS